MIFFFKKKINFLSLKKKKTYLPTHSKNYGSGDSKQDFFSRMALLKSFLPFSQHGSHKTAYYTVCLLNTILMKCNLLKLLCLSVIFINVFVVFFASRY